jgi:hypothetical protein
MSTFNWFIFLVAPLCWFWLFEEICRNSICGREKPFYHFVWLSPWSVQNKQRKAKILVFLFLAIHLASPLEMLSWSIKQQVTSLHGHNIT